MKFNFPYNSIITEVGGSNNAHLDCKLIFETYKSKVPVITEAKLFDDSGSESRFDPYDSPIKSLQQAAVGAQIMLVAERFGKKFAHSVKFGNGGISPGKVATIFTYNKKSYTLVTTFDPERDIDQVMRSQFEFDRNPPDKWQATPLTVKGVHDLIVNLKPGTRVQFSDKEYNYWVVIWKFLDEHGNEFYTVTSNHKDIPSRVKVRPHDVLLIDLGYIITDNPDFPFYNIEAKL